MRCFCRQFSFAVFACALIFNLCIGSTYASSVETQLSKIKQLDDKKYAIKQTHLLLQQSPEKSQDRLAILQLQAQLFFQLQDFSSATTTTNEIRQIANSLDLASIEAKALKMIGVYQYYSGHYPQSLKAYTNALTFYVGVDDQLQQANLYNNIGLVHAAMGDTLLTLESYQKAEAIYEQVGSELDIVDIRYNIAGLYLRLRRFDIAIEMFKKVIEKRLEFKDEKGLASAYSDIAITYKQTADYQTALTYLHKALSYYQKANDRYNLASTYHNLAEVHNELRDSSKAQVYANKSKAISEEHGYQAILAGSLHSLARALFAQGETTLPLVLLKRSNEIATKSGYQQQLRSNLLILPLIYIALGDREEAFKLNQQYIVLSHKLTNEQLNEYLAKFESAGLKQQVAQLEQNKKFQQLEREQADQQKNIVIGAVLAVILVSFFGYRRVIDKQLKAELEVKVKERTEELETVADQLQRANTIKSQFLANMSHEIRTPLTAIIGQSEAIINDDIDAKYLIKEVGIIHSNSLHLLELINNILDLSKIEANKLELELQEHDLHVVLRELANMFTEQAENKGLTFEIRHTLPHPFMLNTDSLRVKQILINLCSNAIKFTPTGSVTISVSINDKELLFEVSDTGIGLSQNQIQRVFESFTQGDNSISRRFGGSGLGLCLSEQLAKLLNGRIEIESVLNQGSTFSFILPVSVPQHINNLEQAQTVSIQSADKVEKVFSGKILLADDHDDNRRLIARFLTSLGLEVVGACDGNEAIEQYLRHRPKVILLDIQMPEMDGIEAFKVLRQKGCSEPIIALTANAMSHEIDHYLELGFTGHLKKPIERQQFISMLDKYFSIDNNDLNTANDILDNVDMSDLVVQFKSSLELEKQDVILHINNNDLTLLRDLAHRIAGAAQMFGFTLLSEKAIRVECAIKTGATSRVNELTQEFLNEIDQVLW